MRCEHVNKEKHIVLVLGNDHSKAGHLFVWRNAAQWTLNNHLSESREAPKDLWKRQSNKLYLLPKGSEAKNHTLHKTVCTSEMCRRAEILLPLFSCCLTIVTEPWWKKVQLCFFLPFETVRPLLGWPAENAFFAKCCPGDTYCYKNDNKGAFECSGKCFVSDTERFFRSFARVPNSSKTLQVCSRCCCCLTREWLNSQHCQLINGKWMFHPPNFHTKALFFYILVLSITH